MVLLSTFFFLKRTLIKNLFFFFPFESGWSLEVLLSIFKVLSNGIEVIFLYLYS